ncbi:hypothetical protein LINGRAHAP2_LOCUS20723, partial [Linum grandiflorum]
LDSLISQLDSSSRIVKNQFQINFNRFSLHSRLSSRSRETLGKINDLPSFELGSI